MVGRICLGRFAVLVVAAIVFPMFAVAKSGHGPSAACMKHLYRMMGALQVYDTDNGALPPADRWMDAALPDPKDELVLHCPTFADHPSIYGYAVQSRLSGKSLQSLEDPTAEPLVFESVLLGRNAHTDKPILPGFRRHGGQFVAYASGEVQILRNPRPTHRH